MYEEYKPTNWDKEHFKSFNNGEPDVVYMELKNQVKEQPVEPQQLKLDFTSATDGVNKIVNGEITPKTIGEADAIITKMANDVEITGHDWKSYAKDADNIPVDIKKLLDEWGFQLFFDETGDQLREISRKELAMTKVLSQLHDEMAKAGENANIETKKQIVDTLQWCRDYIQAIKSAKGEGLNEEKVINQALETFGEKRYTDNTKEGVFGFVDMLEQIKNDLNLNFTEGELIKNKQAIYARLAEINPDLMLNLGQNPELVETFDNIITELVKNQNFNKEAAQKALQNIFTQQEYATIWHASQLAPTTQGWWKNIENWTTGNSSLASYYVHNLLSSPESLSLIA